MTFFKTPLFLFTVLFQIIGPFVVGFGNWANIIQYLSGFGIAYAIWGYYKIHKPKIEILRDQLFQLHAKQDEMRRKQEEIHEKQLLIHDMQQQLHELLKNP